MKPVAFLAAECMLESSPNRREDYFEHKLEFTPLQNACAHEGIQLSEAVWDADDFVPSQYAACVIGTVWDYAQKTERFMQTLETIQKQSRLLNGLDVVKWNAQKSYLLELQTRGVEIVPTIVCDRADLASFERAFSTFDTDRIVAKPMVGACAWRQSKITRGEPLPTADELPPAQTLLQPFLAAAENEGEFSFLFFGDVFSHAVQKIAKPGDYRIQSVFGGHERIYDPPPTEIELARSIVKTTGHDLLYARVDLMRNGEGRLCLMELELIEPYLYPEQGPDMGRHFANALATALDSL